LITIHHTLVKLCVQEKNLFGVFYSDLEQCATYSSHAFFLLSALLFERDIHGKPITHAAVATAALNPCFWRQKVLAV